MNHYVLVEPIDPFNYKEGDQNVTFLKIDRNAIHVGFMSFRHTLT